MADKLGDAFVELTIRDAKFEQAMRGMSASVARHAAMMNARFNSTFKPQMQSMMASGGGGGFGSTMAGVVGGGLVLGGISAAVGQMQSIANSGFEYNSAIEKSTVSFEVLLGSQSRAVSMMDQLRSFAAKTPFDLPTLNQAAVSLLATKKIAQADVLPIMQKLGDAAAGSSEGFASMPRITRAISQMLTKGKIQAEEMMQLSEAGVPAWNALATKMGKSTAEVQKLGEQGKLGVAEVMMLVEGLGDTYKGLAAKQSQTFEGLRSTITDNMQKAFGDASKPLFDFVKKGMTALVKVMDSPKFQAFTDTIASGLQWMIDLGTRFASSPLFQSAVEFAGIAAAAIAAAGGIALIASKIGAAFSLAPFIAVGAAIGGVGILIKRAFAGPEGATFIASLQRSWTLVKEIGTNIYNAVLPAFRAVGDFAASIFGSGGGVQSGVTAFIGNLVGGLERTLNLIAVLSTDFGKAWDIGRTAGEFAVLYLQERFTHLFTVGIPFAIASMLDGMVAAGAVLVDNWKSLFSSLVDSLQTLFNGFLDSQMKRIDSMIEAAKAVSSGNFAGAIGIAFKGQAEASKIFTDAVVKSGTDLASATGPIAAKAAAAFRDAFTNTALAAPKFELSDEAKSLKDKLGKDIAVLMKVRDANLANAPMNLAGLASKGMAAVSGFMSKAKGVGGNLMSAFTAGGNRAMAKGPLAGVVSAIGNFTGGITGLFTAEQKPKATLKSEFTGIADMNKQIQQKLVQSGEEEARKKAVALAEKTKAAMEKTRDATEAVRNLTSQSVDTLGKMLGKLGLAP